MCVYLHADRTPLHRLAKSTLTLIPLLGIHEVVFAFVTDEHAQGTLRYVKLFFDLFLSSFQVSPAPRRTGPLQRPSVSGGTRPGLGSGSGHAPHTSPPPAQGMLVAILYCFVNKEVSRMVWEWVAGGGGASGSQ